MLPDLGALSLAPTGADDDAVTDIHEEREGALRRRREAEQPPIYTLEPGPFSLIVEELAKRLTPDAATVSARSAKTLCERVHQACRELATLNRLPGQAIDPRHDCYADPDGDAWKAAHVIFGVDPTRFDERYDKPPSTWRDNFRHLCKAFDPDLAMELYVAGRPGSQSVDGRDEPPRVVTKSLWFLLWEAVPVNSQLAGEWQEIRMREQWEDDFENVDSDDEEFQPFEEWYEENQYDDYPTTRYAISRSEIRELQTRLRSRDEPHRKELANQLRWAISLARFDLAKGPGNDDEPVDDWLARNGSGHAHEFRIKLDALFWLLGTIRHQAAN
jgi:hypothetical protein